MMVQPDRHFSLEAAQNIAKALEIDWSQKPFEIKQFRMGLEVELEHGPHYPATNITHDDPIIIGKIALAHLNQFPDYYTRLTRMRTAAENHYRIVSEINDALTEDTVEYLESVDFLNDNLEALETTLTELMNMELQNQYSIRTGLEHTHTILKRMLGKLSTHLEEETAHV
jgi:hypothetical protein